MEMEKEVSIEQVESGARRRRVRLAACPHCGGDVRRVRDIYGAYCQCIQCSREMHPGALATSHEINAGKPLMPPVEELMVA